MRVKRSISRVPIHAEIVEASSATLTHTTIMAEFKLSRQPLPPDPLGISESSRLASAE
jgi:hypothetical protein